MPVTLIDPMVPAQGAGIPNSPLVNSFGAALNAYGRSFPTALERSQMNVEDAQTQHLQQQNAAGQNLQNIFQTALNTPTSPPSDTTSLAPMPQGMQGPGMPTTTHNPGVSTGDVMRQALPNLVRAAADSGDPTKVGQLGLTVASYLAGTPGDIANQQPGMPTTLDMAMSGAGHPWAATPGGVLQEHTLGTTEMRSRNLRIQQIVQQHLQPGMSPQQIATLQQNASDIVDGVVEGGLDPTTRQPYVLNKLDLMNGSNGQGIQPANPQNPTPGGGASFDPASIKTTYAAPEVGSVPVNNPGNLRPGGAATGFNQYSTPADGDAALNADLMAKLTGRSAAMAGKPPTITNVFSTYSPPNENATQQLILNASKRMGIDPNAPLTVANFPALKAAILRQEQGGTSPTTQSTAPAPAAAQPTAPAAPSYNMGKVPFESMFGGGLNGAVAQRALGQAGNTVFGGANTVDPVQGAMENLKVLNNAMANTESMHQGHQRGDVQAIAEIKKNYPPTDYDLLSNPGNAQEQTIFTPATARAFYINKLEDMTRQKAFAEQAIAADKAHPQLTPTQREHLWDQVLNINEVLQNAAALSGDTAAPIKPVTPPTNLEKGNALTQPGAYKTATDVKAAFKAGTLTQQQAVSILQSQFGHQ